MIKGFMEGQYELYDALKDGNYPDGKIVVESDIGQDVKSPFGILSKKDLGLNLYWDGKGKRVLASNYQDHYRKNYYVPLRQKNFKSKFSSGMSNDTIGGKMFNGLLPDVYTLQESDIGKEFNRGEKVYKGDVGKKLFLTIKKDGMPNIRIESEQEFEKRTQPEKWRRRYGR
jgi:hypothetical protein